MSKILIDCERLKHPHTGLYHFCLNLGAQLLKQKTTDDDLYFFVPPGKTNVFSEPALFIEKHFYRDIFIPNTKGYRLTFLSTQFDVWHMTHQSSRYRPLNSKTKIVLTIHDLNFLHEHPDNSRKRKKYIAIVQDRIDRADYIVFISNFCKEDVSRNLRIDHKPSSVIYNGCNFFEGDGLLAPAYKPQGPFLFTLGIVLPKKNFHVLPALLQQFDGELIIAGNDQNPYKNKILEEAKKFNVSSRIKFVGTIPEGAKNWYYKNCQAFLFPSIAEGFGLPVIEAMYHGKPVFLSTHTSLPEVGGPTAYYFKNFEATAMQQTLQQGLDHFNQTQPQDEIKKWALHFSWEKAASAYWNIYRQLLMSS